MQLSNIYIKIYEITFKPIIHYAFLCIKLQAKLNNVAILLFLNCFLYFDNRLCYRKVKENMTGLTLSATKQR